MRATVRETLGQVSSLQTQVLTLLGTHLGNISSSLESTATNLVKLNERVDRLHDDNVTVAQTAIETARLLAESNAKIATTLREANEAKGSE
jgi:hypothetical protein